MIMVETGAFSTGFVSTGGLKAFDGYGFFTALQNECLQRFKFKNIKLVDSSLLLCVHNDHLSAKKFACHVILGPNQRKKRLYYIKSGVFIVVHEYID